MKNFSLQCDLTFSTPNWVASLYDNVLLEEMQDTNPLQTALISPLKKCHTLLRERRRAINLWRGLLPYKPTLIAGTYGPELSRVT